MGYTVAFSNQKGGTGKTTTVINTAGALVEMGKRVLVVDIDPQASLTVGLGIDPDSLEKTMYDVLVKNYPISKLIKTAKEGIDLAPTNITLSAAEIDLNSKYRREDKLHQALQSVRKSYDLILVDCPPSLGVFTINALSAADGVVIPMSTAFYSLVGIRLLSDTLDSIKQEINQDLEVLGVLPTVYDKRTKHATEVLNLVRDQLSGRIHVFETVIRAATKVQESPVIGQTVLEYSPSHPVADDYRYFAKELLEVIENGK
jgi:chromosome partitioning protein